MSQLPNDESKEPRMIFGLTLLQLMSMLVVAGIVLAYAVDRWF